MMGSKSRPNGASLATRVSRPGITDKAYQDHSEPVFHSRPGGYVENIRVMRQFK